MNDSMVLDRHYWRERAAHVLPDDISPRDLIRAARILKLQYSAPEAVYEITGPTLPTWQYAPGRVTPSTEALPFDEVKPQTIAAPYVTLSPRGIVGGLMVDARAYDGVAGGGVPDMTPAPDAWSAIKHTLTQHNGQQVVKVRGRARVQGRGTSIEDLPNGMTPGLLCQMLEDLPRNSVGAVGYQVQALTDLAYPGLPRVFDDLTEPDTDLMRAMHAPGLLRAVAGQMTQYEDEHKVSWPIRVRLRGVRARKSEPVTPRSLIAPADRADAVFVGHRLVKRGKVTRRGGKRAERTIDIGRVTIDSPLALATLADGLNRGERVQVLFNGVKLTLTRGKGTAGTFTVSTPAGKASGLRTAGNVARRASELVA